MQHKIIEEQLRELDALISSAKSVLVRFPYQTNIRQNISTLKERRRELMKQLQEPTMAAPLYL